MIGQFCLRVVKSLLVSAEARCATLAILPPGWPFDELLDEFRSRDRVLILDISDCLPTPWPSAIDVLVLDARKTNTEQLRRVVATTPREAVVLILIDAPVLLEVANLRTFGPVDFAVTARDLDPTGSATTAARVLLERAVRISGGHPALCYRASELVRRSRFDEAESLLDSPGSDPVVRSAVESAWHLVGTDGRQLLSLIASVPGLTSDDAADLGVRDPSATWQQCQATGLVDPRADGWALTAQAQQILQPWLRPETDSMRLPGLMASSRHEVVIHALVISRRPQINLSVLRTMWQQTAFHGICFSPVRPLALELLDDLIPGVAASERGWLLAARGTLRTFSGFPLGALADLRSAIELSDDPSPIRFRIIRVLCSLGRLDECQQIAQEVFDEDDRPWNRAHAAGWIAIVDILQGRLEAAESMLDYADVLAANLRDLPCLAALSTGRSMAAGLRGHLALHHHHLRLATGYARAANDIPLVARLLDIAARSAFREARLEDALKNCDEARRVCRENHLESMLPDTLLIAAQIHRARGDLDQAIHLLDSSELLTSASGSSYVGLVLQARGLCYLLKGDLRQAREDLSQALPLCRSVAPQTEAQALLGLSMVDLVEGEFTTAAARMARVSDFAEPMRPGHYAPLLAIVRWLQGDPDATRTLPQGLASSIKAHDVSSELLCRGVAAVLASPPDVGELKTVITRWQSISMPLRAAIWQLVLGRILGGAEGAQLQATASEVLEKQGAYGPLNATEAFAEMLTKQPRPEPESCAQVRITLLGRFGVSRGGEEIAASFGSRKARILVQLLASRRGGSLTRDRLREILWPGSNTGRLRSVISEVRAALDPGKRFPPGAFIKADGTAVWIEARTVQVDASEVLSCAARGRRAAANGDLDEMAARYEEAAERYTGEVTVEVDCEETAGLQEELRVTIGDVHRALARTAHDQNRLGSEVSWWTRVLADDPYDLRAHSGVIRALVQQGRRGLANEAYQRYCQRMAEIGVTPDRRLDPQPDRSDKPRPARGYSSSSGPS